MGLSRLGQSQVRDSVSITRAELPVDDRGDGVGTARWQPPEPYLTLQEFIAYAKLSRATVMRYLRAADPLPCYRPLGPRRKLFFRISDYDRWMRRWRVTTSRALVDEAELEAIKRQLAIQP